MFSGTEDLSSKPSFLYHILIKMTFTVNIIFPNPRDACSSFPCILNVHIFMCQCTTANFKMRDTKLIQYILLQVKRIVYFNLLKC